MAKPFNIEEFLKELDRVDRYYEVPQNLSPEKAIPLNIKNACRYVDTHPHEFADCYTREKKVARAFYLHTMGKLEFPK